MPSSEWSPQHQALTAAARQLRSSSLALIATITELTDISAAPAAGESTMPAV